MRATLIRPASIAAAACSTWITKEEPPTAVPSVYFGWMPRYSATWRLGDQPGPAGNPPSTSDMSMPASARALRAASAWSARGDLWGPRPGAAAPRGESAGRTSRGQACKPGLKPCTYEPLRLLLQVCDGGATGLDERE